MCRGFCAGPRGRPGERGRALRPRAVGDVGQGAQQQTRLRRPRRVQVRWTQPADGAAAAPVGGRRGQIVAGAQPAHVQRGGVVPAHAVQQAGQPGRRSGGDEEVGAAVRAGRHRAQGQAHALHAHQGPSCGGLGDLDRVEGTPEREHHRGVRRAGPGPGDLLQRGARRDLGGGLEGMRAGGGAVPAAAGAGPGDGPCAAHHVPPPQAGVLGHRRALGGAVRPAAPPGAGADLAHPADREAHAPSNGSATRSVTVRMRNVTLCVAPSLRRHTRAASGCVPSGEVLGARPVVLRST